MATQARTNYRRMLLSRLLEARAETDALFQIVRPEALYDRPIAERHRIVFYVGHLEAFDWNLLSGPCGLTSNHPEFDRLFAFGIDPVGGGLPADQPHEWPRLEMVNEYRDGIRQALDRALETTPENEFELRSNAHGGALCHSPGDDPDDDEGSFGQLLHIAIEHRLMHAETLAYMFHQLPFERKTGAAAARVFHSSPLTPEGVRIPAGRAALGLRRDSQVFGWDNEFEAYCTDVQEFTIDKYKVTNGQFLPFIEGGGYRERSLWTKAGWDWKAAQGISHPAFWVGRGNTWAYQSMFDEVPLPLDWPVYVSHAEASAYARWTGKRLPTEPQWHRAAYGTPGVREREYPWGDEPPADSSGATWDPAPVNACALAGSAFGVEGLIGNGWEWTATQFAPFPGFQPFACYPGYSAQFFDARHYVLKGGSVRTAACMLRRSFRNWFQPHYQYVYAGFRCASD